VAKRGEKIALKPGARDSGRLVKKFAAGPRASSVANGVLERLERRGEQVRILMRLEFPYSWAPPPPPDLPSPADLGSSISPRDSRSDHKSWKRDEAKRKQRRSELLAMSDAQFDTASSDAWGNRLKKDRARREKLTPAAIEPEWQFWTREDVWALYDAALLLVALEPRQALGLLLKDLANGRKTATFPMQMLPVSKSTSMAIGRHRQTHGGFIPEDLNDDATSKLEAVEEITRRALVANQKTKLRIENGTVMPNEFLNWACGKGYEIPKAFVSLIHQHEASAIDSNKGHTKQATAKATRASAEKRRMRHVERDQRIHDMHSQGKTRKEISRAVGSLSESQIGRVLARARPRKNG
jgi:hypothetical protein